MLVEPMMRLFQDVSIKTLDITKFFFNMQWKKPFWTWTKGGFLMSLLGSLKNFFQQRKVSYCYFYNSALQEEKKSWKKLISFWESSELEQKWGLHSIYFISFSSQNKSRTERVLEFRECLAWPYRLAQYFYPKLYETENIKSE